MKLLEQYEAACKVRQLASRIIATYRMRLLFLSSPSIPISANGRLERRDEPRSRRFSQMTILAILERIFIGRLTRARKRQYDARDEGKRATEKAKTKVEILDEMDGTFSRPERPSP